MKSFPRDWPFLAVVLAGASACSAHAATGVQVVVQQWHPLAPDAQQPDPDRTLMVTRAVFTLGGATIDSQNLVGDILTFVSGDLIPFFGGPNFKRLAEDAVNAVSIDLARNFDTALAPVNARLKGPSGAVRVGVAAGADRIKVAFAPREFVPPTDGRMGGTLRWNPAEFGPRSGCASFDIRATRVVDGGTSRSAGSSLYGVSHGLSGDGWDGRNVTPQPVAAGRNYVVTRSIDATALEAPSYGSMRQVVANETDARINPADTLVRADTVGAWALSAGARVGDAVSLNPQPLPPRPDSAVESAATTRASQAGIIIVSGRSEGTDRVAASGVGSLAVPRVDPAVLANAQTRSGDGIDLDALADRGPAIAAADPLAMELRGRQAGDGARRGFDIGMAAAEGQTEPGPGKDRIRDALPNDQKGGFLFAVSFSLDRNRNAARAAAGAAIAAADPAVDAARRAQPDVLHRLGFDIATGIFGDPALGAQGNTVVGPGAMGIRNALGPSALQGFDDGVAFHLGRTY